MADTNKQKALSKTQLVARLAEQFSLPKKDVGALLDGLAELAYEQTSNVGEFTIPGIGKLIKQERAARSGRNPATGETIQIAAKSVVKFRVAKAAKDAILPAG